MELELYVDSPLRQRLAENHLYHAIAEEYRLEGGNVVNSKGKIVGKGGAIKFKGRKWKTSEVIHLLTHGHWPDLVKGCCVLCPHKG